MLLNNIMRIIIPKITVCLGSVPHNFLSLTLTTILFIWLYASRGIL